MATWLNSTQSGALWRPCECTGILYLYPPIWEFDHKHVAKSKKKHQSSCVSDFSKQVILQPFSSHYLLSAGASGAWKAPLSFVRWSADFIKRKEVLPEKAAKWLLAGRAQLRMTVRNNMQFSDTKWLTGGIVLSYYKPNVYTRLQSGVLEWLFA